MVNIVDTDKVVESQATIPLRDLILQIGPHAKGVCQPLANSIMLSYLQIFSLTCTATIPENLKDELLSKLRIFVENNVEE